MAEHATVRVLMERRGRLVEYLLDKVAVADWHGVADAAMDLRELEVALDLVQKLGPRET